MLLSQLQYDIIPIFFLHYHELKSKLNQTGKEKRLTAELTAIRKDTAGIS